MTPLLAGIADLPLALLAAAWWQPLPAQGRDSAVLERIAASILLLAASACLWNALIGAEWLWLRWPVHVGAVLMIAALPHLRSGRAARLPVPVLLGRLAAYAGGLALASLPDGGSFGQNALSAW